MCACVLAHLLAPRPSCVCVCVSRTYWRLGLAVCACVCRAPTIASACMCVHRRDHPPGRKVLASRYQAPSLLAMASRFPSSWVSARQSAVARRWVWGNWSQVGPVGLVSQSGCSATLPFACIPVFTCAIAWFQLSCLPPCGFTHEPLGGGFYRLVRARFFSFPLRVRPSGLSTPAPPPQCLTRSCVLRVYACSTASGTARVVVQRLGCPQRWHWRRSAR